MRAFVLGSLFAAAVRAWPEMAGNLTYFNPFSTTLSCEGTSTYGATPIETVTVTVDGEYTYAGNSTATDTYYYTPPPPCSEVVIPGFTTAAPEGPTTNSDFRQTMSSYLESTWTSVCASMTMDPNTTTKGGAPYANLSSAATSSCSSAWLWRTESTAPWESTLPPVPGPSAASSPGASHTGTANPLITLISSEVASYLPPSSAAPAESASFSLGKSFSVTVTVTKKTPAPSVNVGGVTQPGPTFPGDQTEPTNVPMSPGQNVAPTPSGVTNDQKTTDNAVSTNGPGPGSHNPQPSNTPGSSNNNNNAPGQSNNNNNDSPGQSNTSGNNNSPGQTNGNNNAPGPSSNNNQNSPTNGGNNNVNNPSPSGNGLGSIINSAFNSPFTTIGVATSFGSASATVTLVAGVPVQVRASSVYIGGSNVALPTGSSTAFVTIAGQTLAVKASAIVAGAETLTLQRSESVSYSAVQAAPLAVSTVTQNGVVVTVQPAAAVVNGRTFTIGLNAQETSAIIDGQTITFNSNGVIFPSTTTYRPAITTAAAYVVTAINSLTFSIDQSEAIIGGTTFRIGAGALNSKTTTVISGTTVVFGPSGIELPNTTIEPTGVSLTTEGSSSRTSASAATRVVSETAGPIVSGNSGTTIYRPSAYLGNAICVVVMVLASATLPLSLLL